MAFFVAFYSYKGGVGRSLALANVAYSLAMRGKRVVMIDMDLEAPALLGFPEFALRGKAPKKGLVEYAGVYQRKGTCPPVTGYVHPCRRSPGTGKLWVMPSGRLDASYPQKLGKLSWRSLHPRKGTAPLIDGLRNALVEEFNPHYVLIDSRTGFSDVGGISTHLLADMVVLMFNLTWECIEGSVRAYRSFLSSQTKVRTLQLVASPIPPVAFSEDSLVEKRLRQAQKYMPEGNAYGRETIRIVYDPSMALAERLAVLTPSAYAAFGKYEDLREAIQRSNEKEIFPVVQEARRWRSEGRWEDALNHLQSFVQEHPTDVDGYMELGRFLLEAGRVEEASQCFQSATKLSSDLTAAHRMLGEALTAAKEPKDAVTSLKRAQELGDLSRETFEALATAYESIAETADGETKREALQSSLEAKRHAASLTLKTLPPVSEEEALTLPRLHDDLVRSLTRRPQHGTLDAEQIWRLLVSTKTLTPVQKYSAAKALIQGDISSSQILDLTRLLQKKGKGQPPDLELRITTERIGDDIRLRFVLHSPAGSVGYVHYLVGETVIRSSLEKYQNRMLQELELLAVGRSVGGSPLSPPEINRELEVLGRELYDDIFPTELKAVYQELRDKITTLMIVSDEPWIPWEMIKPYSEDTDDDFLCCRFELTRWLSGTVAPVIELVASRVVSIASSPPELESLPYAVEEAGLLDRLAERHSNLESIRISNATYEDVENVLLNNEHTLIHFVGHGHFDSSDPAAPRLLLSDGRSWRPRDLTGPIQTKIRHNRPMVFFNSCQSARSGFSLNRLGGWASRWVHDCGCGAFIGPQWNITDASAHLFASTFYDALERGETIAQAVRGARLRVRQEMPASTAWLAYNAYAHPNARLRLGVETTENDV